MTVLEVINGPWAILPSKLRQIQSIYAAHVRGDKIDIGAIEAALGKPLNNERQDYEVAGGVAILPIEGVLAPKVNMLTRISGGTSMQMIEGDLARATADESVYSIILAISSPGGTVQGTQELACAVRAAAEKKPVVALASGMMASSAYWIGSAADSIYISADTVQVGSIGVAMTHADHSQEQERAGVTITDVYAGKWKRITSENKPLSDEGRETLQAMVDELYRVFVEAVADNRGVSVDVVLKNMADGRVFIGRKAIDAGLVDGATTLSGLIGQLNGGAYRRRRQAGRVASGSAIAASTQPLSLEERLRARWEAEPQLRAEYGGDIALFLAYERAADRTRRRRVRV
jgi:signal peptide peptidase SppA